MNTHSRALTRALLAASLLTTVSSLTALPAAAADSDSHSMVVRYSDLDITQPKDALTLYSRITEAATRVCPALISADLQSTGRMRGCVNKAIADSVAKINQPALTAVYEARHAGAALAANR